MILSTCSFWAAAVFKNISLFLLRNGGTWLFRWHISVDVYNGRYWPDYCVGWAYVVTPQLGLLMAEAATNLTPEQMRIKDYDDTFQGVVIKHIRGAKVEPLEAGWAGHLWNNYLSYCPFVSVVKNNVIDRVVLRKGKYKGTPTETMWFLFCLAWEDNVLYYLEISPTFPTFLKQLCHGH